MKYMVKESYVDVIGKIWMPAVTAAYRYPVSNCEIENMRDENGKITRETVGQWTLTHSGDFQSIEDFSASIEDGDDTLDFPWEQEESEYTYNDCILSI